MTGDITPPHEERIDPREGAVDAARVEALLETLQVTADGEANPPPADPSSDASPSPDGEAGERLGQLEAELAALRSENESLRGQYMRIAADFDNFRKRQSRDKEDQRLHITCTTLTEILPVVDNFDRARQQLNPQSEEAQTLHRSYQNLYKQLVDVFKQLGVSPMRVEGEPFDPSLHEAVMREPSEEHPEDVVIEELQRGYHLDGRVLRHALVKVSLGPGPGDGARSAETSAPPSEGQSD
jgi:molecular chaperone GrpE